MDWQPIETAPRDGTRVLLYGRVLDIAFSEDGAIAVGEFNAPEWVVSCSGYSMPEVNPTHWMPLPNPPA